MNAHHHPPRRLAVAPDEPSSHPPVQPEFSTLRTSPEDGAGGGHGGPHPAATVKPTVRVLPDHPGSTAPGGGGASVRVGALPDPKRVLPGRTDAAPARLTEVGWTQPTRTKPFVTRTFSGVRIKSAEPPPAARGQP